MGQGVFKNKYRHSGGIQLCRRVKKSGLNKSEKTLLQTKTFRKKASRKAARRRSACAELWRG